MALSLRSSIKSSLFSSRLSFCLEWISLSSALGIQFQKESQSWLHRSFKRVSPYCPMRGSLICPKNVWQLFHTFTFCIIQPLLESTHYDLIDSLDLSIPLWISRGGVPLPNAQFITVPPEGFGRPLSEMRVWGILNWVTIFFHTNLLASTSLVFASCSASTHLVK